MKFTINIVATLAIGALCLCGTMQAAKLTVLNGFKAGYHTGVQVTLTDTNADPRGGVIQSGATWSTNALLAGFTGITFIDENGNIRQTSLNIPGVTIGTVTITLLPGGVISIQGGGILVDNTALSVPILVPGKSAAGSFTITPNTNY